MWRASSGPWASIACLLTALGLDATVPYKWEHFAVTGIRRPTDELRGSAV